MAIDGCIDAIKTTEDSSRFKFERPRGIDTANWFNQGNYTGQRIREVHLMEKEMSPNNLSFMFFQADKKGYKTFSLGIVNISHGDSRKNEPAEAIFLSKSYPNRVENPEALIVRTSDTLYDFYEGANFRFMP